MEDNTIRISTTIATNTGNERFVEPTCKGGLEYQVTCNDNTGNIFVLARAFLAISATTKTIGRNSLGYSK